MIFDSPNAPVSRYMRRIDAESLGKNELDSAHKSGICFNNLLFNEVGWFVDSKRESSGEPDYEILGNPGEPDRGPLFTCCMMEERIFSHENGRFHNWWYADLYDDLIVFYAPFKDGEKDTVPVKAWRRYNQVWRGKE
ncbi:hypothetical protein [Collinsella tanakaei]|nr:hypothetical protein [Collinsella tanakaei]